MTPANNGLCLCTAAQYVLLFLVWFNNSKFTELHALTLAACSYALLVLPTRGVYRVYALSVGSISNLCHIEAANYHASFVQTIIVHKKSV